jgi:Bacterial CdiA-CT RNAse A domain
MVLPRRDRSPGLRVQLAIIALVVLGLGIWQLQRQQPHVEPPTAPAGPATTAPAEPPADTDRPASRAAERESYDLDADEAKGGHTIARHVGRTDQQLRDRLDRERNISAASTYTDRVLAERTVARTLARHSSRVAGWRKRSGSRPNLALDYRGPAKEIIGRSLRRGRAVAVPCTDAVVVLRWDGNGGFVLTSYPEAAR